MKIALMIPDKPAWTGPSRAQMFYDHYRSMGHECLVIPGPDRCPGYLAEYDLIIDHAFTAGAGMLRPWAERHPATQVLFVNHSSLPYLEHCPHHLAAFTSALWAARTLPNCWLGSQDPSLEIGDCERVIHFPTPVWQLPPREYRDPATPPKIVLAGRASSVKNTLTQIVAAASLPQSEIHFCMQPSNSVHYLLKALNVRAIGHSQKQHPDWLWFLKTEADVVLQCSLTESLNMVALEAQQTGVPTIASSCVAAADLELTVENPSDHRQISRLIRKALADYPRYCQRATELGTALAQQQIQNHTHALRRICNL